MAWPAALLLFPLRPAAASAALSGRWPAALFAFVPAALFGGFLLARGSTGDDALAAGAALGLLTIGLGFGGALTSVPAAALLGVREDAVGRLVPCLVAAGWAAILFALALGAGRLAGAGGKAALFAGFALLFWGATAGVGLLLRGRDAEGGRALVGSCLGLFGAIAGLWIALSVVQERIVLPLPSPAKTAQFGQGDLLLVRRGAPAATGDIVLRLRGRDAILCRVEESGRFRPLGPVRIDVREGFATAGRVFFRFGGAGFGSAVAAE